MFLSFFLSTLTKLADGFGLKVNPNTQKSVLTPENLVPPLL
ncbi:hypothetical protein QFZ80_001444 [Paenibacillus sp. V4I7]|nr:hypothetical protein [Paenibacillus sp. V4I7]MDQ0916378.1 hypothetical protein [Paenibacillus sp. V4I5]